MAEIRGPLARARQDRSPGEGILARYAERRRQPVGPALGALAQFGLEMLPGAGDAAAIRDSQAAGAMMAQAFRQGNYGEALKHGALAGALGLGALPMLPAFGGIIKAYHGSPHRFDKFSMRKVGTGEGVQNEGFGLYFAEDPSVGKDYQLASSTPKIDGGDIDWGNNSHSAAYWTWKLRGRKNAADYMERTVRSQKRFGDVQGAEHAQRTLDLLQSDKKLPDLQPTAPLYEVMLDVDPDQLLDWDVPFSSQPKRVQDVLKSAALDRGQEETGKEIYERLQKELFETPELTSYGLRDMGIPGVRFDDYHFALGVERRNNPSGARNVNIFDDNLITIDRIE